VADRTTDFQNLPAKLKSISAALDEMNKVVTGGFFNPDQIWGATAVADIPAHMKMLADTKIAPSLRTEVDKLLKGLPTSSTVGSAISTVLNGVQKAVDEIFKINSELGVSGRLEAFNNLNDPHPEGDYAIDPAAGENFGLFPALEGVINAGLDTQIDLDNYLEPLHKVVAVAAGAQSVAYFTQYATGSLQLLQKALTPSA
jgi:hypothetical protein